MNIATFIGKFHITTAMIKMHKEELANDPAATSNFTYLGILEAMDGGFKADVTSNDKPGCVKFVGCCRIIHETDSQ